MLQEHRVCPMLSQTLFEIFASKYIWVTTLTFQGHVTSSVTWPIDVSTRPFPIGVPFEPSLYLQPFSRYSAPKPARVHTHIYRHTPQVILYAVPCNVLHIGQTMKLVQPVVIECFAVGQSQSAKPPLILAKLDR